MIEELIKRQTSEKATDEAFAKKLGIARGTWNRIKNGKQTMGYQALLKVKTEYAELTQLVDFYLTNGITKVINKEG